MTLAQILWARVTVWRVRRLLAKATRHQDASARFAKKAARIMPAISP